MHQAGTSFRDNPAAFRATLMGLAGMGLLFYVVSGWLDGGSQVIITAYDATAPVQTQVSPGGPLAAIAMLVGFVLLLVACVLLLQSRQTVSASVLRDPLTGLYKRLYAEEALPGLAARDDRNGHSRLALVQVEVESIDELRYRYGIGAVDMVMATVGCHIRSQTREDDLPVEPGRDGFEIYLHCEDIDQARAYCRRLATLMRSEQLDWHGDVIKVTVTTQITLRKLGESIEALQKRSRTPSSSAREQRGNRIEA